LKVFSRHQLETMKDDRYRARLINCMSGVKTAFLVGTSDSQGQTNLAVFSNLFHLGANPALMGLIFRPHVTPRHTLENLKETGFLTVNLLASDYQQSIHHTSARFSKEQSEFEGCGLTSEFLGECPAPFVKEAKLKWSLSFVRQIDIPENGTHMIIGAVEDIFVPEDVIKEDGFLDLASLDPCLVTGLDCYHQVTPGVRYSYAKPDHKPQILS
jgi:flavin reductase (DIM6/NTAB) family NADH-FMN oxidoreductase RutF